MHGSRKLALDFIAPHLKPGLRVLDICCGGAWLMEHVHAAGGVYFGIDKRAKNCDVTEQHDISVTPWMIGQYDLAVSCYGMQHLLGDEAIAWREARNHAKKLIVIGRLSAFPLPETHREDPLNGYDESGIRGLALATGWDVDKFFTFEYSGDEYKSTGDSGDGNAFFAVMEILE